MTFPQYLNVFSKVTTQTSLELLDKYTSPKAFLEAPKDDIINIILNTARFGLTYASKKYTAIINAAQSATVFGYSTESSNILIRVYIDFIRKFDSAIEDLLNQMHKLVDEHEDETFVKIVLGEEPIEAWDEFVEYWSANGGQDILDELQAWVDANP